MELLLNRCGEFGFRLVVNRACLDVHRDEFPMGSPIAFRRDPETSGDNQDEVVIKKIIRLIQIAL